MPCFVLTGLLPVVLAATGAAPLPQSFSEASFLAALDARHPELVARQQSVAAARARARAAAVFDNPELTLQREDPQGPTSQADWTLAWPLPHPDRSLEIAARKETVLEAEAVFDQDLLLLRLAMRKAYADWAVAATRHRRLAAQAEWIEALAGREAARARQGESSGLEAQRLGLAAAELRARASLAAVAAGEARAIVESWLPTLPAAAEPSLPALPPAPRPQPEHPLLLAAEAAVRAADLEARAAGRFLHAPELLVGWQTQDTGARTLEGPVFGLSWSVPLFDRRQAERDFAEVRSAAARARLEIDRRHLAAARRAATGTYRQLAGALGNARAAGEGSGRMLHGAEASFRAGESSLTDLLETLHALTEAQMTELDLHAAALAAHRELERLAGAVSQFDPDHHLDSQEAMP